MAIIQQIEEKSKPKPGPSLKAGDGPGLSAPGERDFEATMKSLDQMPFFMREMPKDDQEIDPAQQDALEALKSLAFDGTPDEVAANFKDQGNQNFVAKRFREAMIFYTQALEAHPTDEKLRETLHANRAACHLELGNYGSCLRDTSATIGLNPKNSKAYYRAGRAFLALDKTDEAIDCCEHALKFDPDNEPIKAIKKKSQDRKALMQKWKEEKEERERRKKELETAIKQALLSRGLWLETSPRPPDNPKPAHFDPESLPASSSPSLPLTGSKTRWTAPDPIRTPLVLPVFFMYPQYAQSDLVSEYHEDTPVGAHLDAMFPPESRGSLPWDTKGEYTTSNLQVYVTTQKMRLLKIGRKLSLREIMDQASVEGPAGRPQDRDGMVMRDGILSLVILPKGDAEKEWIASYKAKREEAQAKK